MDTPQKKVAFVVQRYGSEITGGSEYHCRSVAEHLSPFYDITVLTTCARDYWTWENVYPPGESRINGIRVIRYRTSKTRDLEAFNAFSDRIFHHAHTPEEELRWLSDQGPYCPELIDFIDNNKKDFDVFFFFTYLYFPAYHGIRLVGEKSILQPTAHDEPAIHLELYRDMFSRVKGVAFNTPTEEKLLRRLFPLTGKISGCVGAGIDTDAFEAREVNAPGRFMLYGGRIAPGKGCEELLDFFLRFRRETNDATLELALMGNREMTLPDHPRVTYLGFVSNEEKLRLFQSARFVVIPSPFESLSLLLLEAFASRKGVLVNGRCDVLKDHCLKSNGGLFYENYDEFKACLLALEKDPGLRQVLGENGFQYVKSHYAWEKVSAGYRRLIDRIG